MIQIISIRVECHSGYKADEYPKNFTRDGKIFIIQEIIDRWYQGNSDSEIPVSDYFKVRTDSGELFIIKHEIAYDQWFLCQSK